jgi:hypothetical protein
MIASLLVSLAMIADAPVVQSKQPTSDVLQIVDTPQLPLKPPPLSGGQGELPAPEPDSVVVERFYRTVALVAGLAQAGKQPAVPPSVAGAMGQYVSRDRTKFKFTFEPMILQGAELLSIGPMGTLQNHLWTGAEQFYRLPSGAYVRIQDVHLSATGGKMYLNRSAVNAEVKGSPASIMQFRTRDGRRVEEIIWTVDGRMLTLTFAPNSKAAPPNSGLSAHQLASSLTPR